MNLEAGAVSNHKTDSNNSRTRQLQVVVYPALAAFILLASYGFYLVYNLTRDVHRLSIDVSTLTKSVDRNMTIVARSMQNMNRDTNIMAQATMKIQQDMRGLNTNVSKPFAAMNSMMPWGGNNYAGPYPGSGRPMYANPNSLHVPN